MPWSRTSPMAEKTKFIADYLRKILGVSELCDLYGISRKTGHELIRPLHQRRASGSGRAFAQAPPLAQARAAAYRTDTAGGTASPLLLGGRRSC